MMPRAHSGEGGATAAAAAAAPLNLCLGVFAETPAGYCVIIGCPLFGLIQQDPSYDGVVCYLQVQGSGEEKQQLCRQSMN